MLASLQLASVMQYAKPMLRNYHPPASYVDTLYIHHLFVHRLVLAIELILTWHHGSR